MTPGAAAGSATETAAPRSIARALKLRMRGRRLLGRVRAAAAPACARGVPVRLERRRRGVWRLVAKERTGSDRRFALRLPRAGKRLRVRLPRVALNRAGALLHCEPLARRLP